MVLNWAEIAYISKSKLRTKILEIIQEKPKNPTTIAKMLNNHRSTISKHMNDLAKKGYLECLNPNDKTYRLYKITKKGEQALQKTKELANE